MSTVEDRRARGRLTGHRAACVVRVCEDTQLVRRRLPLEPLNHSRHVSEESTDPLQTFQTKDRGRAHVPGTFLCGELELPAVLRQECRTHAQASVVSEALCIEGGAEI